MSLEGEGTWKKLLSGAMRDENRAEVCLRACMVSNSAILARERPVPEPAVFALGESPRFIVEEASPELPVPVAATGGGGLASRGAVVGAAVGE
jgi:hypothetical protein